MTNASLPLRDRIGAAMLTVAVVAVLGYLLMLGLAFRRAAEPVRQETVFAMTPDPPPPPARVVPPPRRVSRPSGRAAPPNLRSKATAITAPVPIILLTPPPITVAPLPDLGVQASSGASDRAGPGTGAGGIGNGHGAGGDGDGDGDGGGWERMPRLIRGRIKRSDIPESVLDSGFHGSVDVRFSVETDGRVTGCAIARSSGDALIDQATCQAIEARFRYRPWRDADGRPVRSTVLREQYWDIDPPSSGK